MSGLLALIRVRRRGRPPEVTPMAPRSAIGAFLGSAERTAAPGRGPLHDRARFHPAWVATEEGACDAST